MTGVTGQTETFAAAAWQPLPRPAGVCQAVTVERVDEPQLTRADVTALVGTTAGPEVLSDDGDTAIVRFWHHAPSARAVALSASGWWWPCPANQCDFDPVGAGWWCLSLRVPSDWQASYRFVEHDGEGDPPWWVNGLRDPGSPAVPDGANPLSHTAARGTRSSVVRMPRARRPRNPAQQSPHASTTSGELHQLALETGPPISVWHSGPTELTAPVPLIVFTDGEAHVQHLDTPGLLGHAVAQGALPPLAAAFVPSGAERSTVLGVPWGHAAWIAEALVPYLHARGIGGRAIDDRPNRTIITGSSFGGLTALFALARAPERIGCAVAQSTSLWRYPEGSLAAPLIAAARRGRVRVRLQTGRFEGSMPTSNGALADELGDAGVNVTSRIINGGHDWAWWQPTAIDAIADLLGAPADPDHAPLP
ncbi:alpha/beta hydrolase-fold protein [Paramicrobacterium chengjingii]|uniref:alpha/beta hydrolase-fold protein n=1 Tax=Paramicrobacterium chengjingii TaxID=2769067 RepID=UPI001422E5F5|nr:alpha/beta hydrolase-fold protein [Microbacterium chengjingii]